MIAHLRPPRCKSYVSLFSIFGYRRLSKYSSMILMLNFEGSGPYSKLHLAPPNIHGHVVVIGDVFDPEEAISKKACQRPAALEANSKLGVALSSNPSVGDVGFPSLILHPRFTLSEVNLLTMELLASHPRQLRSWICQIWTVTPSISALVDFTRRSGFIPQKILFVSIDISLPRLSSRRKNWSSQEDLHARSAFFLTQQFPRQIRVIVRDCRDLFCA